MKLTDEAVLRAALALAEACNGGRWADYHPDQQALWIRRVIAAMEVKA